MFHPTYSPDHYHLPVKVCYEHSYNSAQVLRKANAEHLVVSKCPDSAYLQDAGIKEIILYICSSFSLQIIKFGCFKS